jgi:hypothetical protein
MQKRLLKLKWLNERQSLGLISECQVGSCKKYFAELAGWAPHDIIALVRAAQAPAAATPMELIKELMTLILKAQGK